MKRGVIRRTKDKLTNFWLYFLSIERVFSFKRNNQITASKKRLASNFNSLDWV